MSEQVTGMGWQCQDKKADTETRIQTAVTYYQNKYGKRPLMVLVNAAEQGDVEMVDGTAVEGRRNIQPGQLLLVMEKSS